MFWSENGQGPTVILYSACIQSITNTHTLIQPSSQHQVTSQGHTHACTCMQSTRPCQDCSLRARTHTHQACVRTHTHTQTDHACTHTHTHTSFPRPWRSFSLLTKQLLSCRTNGDKLIIELFLNWQRPLPNTHTHNRLKQNDSIEILLYSLLINIHFIGSCVAPSDEIAMAKLAPASDQALAEENHLPFDCSYNPLVSMIKVAIEQFIITSNSLKLLLKQSYCLTCSVPFFLGECLPFPISASSLLVFLRHSIHT